MRFLVDECTGPFVAKWLREQAHDVFSVYDSARGLDDEVVIETLPTSSHNGGILHTVLRNLVK